MVSEIESLLKEQEMANSHLELLDDNKELFQDILLETMVSNEELDNISTAVAKLSNTMMLGVGILSKSLGNFEFEQQALLPAPINLSSPDVEIPKQDINVSQPTISISNEPAIQELNNQINPITPVITAPDDTASSELNSLVDSSIDSNKQLVKVESGISTLVEIQKGIFQSQEDAMDKGGLANRDGVEEVDDGATGGILGGMLGGGKLAAAAAGIAGAVGTIIAIAATLKFLFDLYDGFNNAKLAKELTGKSLEDLSGAENSSVAIANAISKLSFGMLDSKSVFEAILPVVETLSKGIDELFDPEFGLFAGFTNMILKLMDGDFAGALDVAANGMLDMPLRIVDKLSEWLGSLFDSIVNLLPKSAGDLLKDTSSAIKGFFGIEGDIKDVVKGATSKIRDAANITEAGKFIPERDGVFANKDNPFGRAIAKFTDDTVVPQNKNEIIEPLAIKQRSSDRFTDSVVIPGKSNGAASPVSPNLQTAEALSASKEFMVEPKIIIQQVATQQPIPVPISAGNKKQIIRRTESRDLSLAMMNSGSMDG